MSFILLESNLNVISCIFLFLTTVLSWGQQLYSNIYISRVWPKILLKLSSIILTIILLQRWFASGHIPLSNLYESSTFLSWSLTLIYYILRENEWTIAIIAPTSLLLQIFVNFSLPLPTANTLSLVPALQSNWLTMHVSMMVCSYGLLIFGSIISIIFLIISQISYLSIFANEIEKQFFLVRQQNLLNELDYWSYRLIGLGFPILTIGILSGAVWANEAWGTYWSWDPKETWAMLTWIIFAIYLHTRISKNWNGVQPAIVACLGLGIIWICYLGVNLLGQGLHSYGWINK
jgi:cytochrome c-type biogenesis protein CcsB